MSVSLAVSAKVVIPDAGVVWLMIVLEINALLSSSSFIVWSLLTVKNTVAPVIFSATPSASLNIIVQLYVSPLFMTNLEDIILNKDKSMLLLPE